MLAAPALRAPAGLASSQSPARPALRATLANAVSGPNPGANVEAIKEGDKVVRLVVTCACGERVEIECLYPAGS